MCGRSVRLPGLSRHLHLHHLLLLGEGVDLCLALFGLTLQITNLVDDVLLLSGELTGDTGLLLRLDLLEVGLQLENYLLELVVVIDIFFEVRLQNLVHLKQVLALRLCRRTLRLCLLLLRGNLILHAMCLAVGLE